ncbi:S-layer homology domain-containing protein [Intestinimonas massiliensis (ex Afouda et al. 2020)]|uniref:S-layer homology domain-containing protein n=1 Tax=Intestinimonas massiliensis (ex Afouda et al. 2020) TaxID=1673721 RepID=UPI00103201D2|nr:S-layer homology domain-containing protein [Intestinimonas massiliensis (ex Afouda et al. 2020)]
MRNVKSRMLSLLLALCMLFTLLPISALAADAERFDDVKADSWYYSYVDYVTEKGFFQGISSTRFAPEDTMTRAMFVTAVSRVAGKTGDASVAPFDDVPADTWYTAAVDWAVSNGVINGIGGNRFNPEKEITREDMCVTMARFISYLETSQNKTFKKTADPIAFPDADQISSYAKDAVERCVAYGLVYGTGDGTFQPKAYASRAEVAAMIYRLSLMTTQPTGGGSTGGGGGTPAVTNYTLTLDPNYEGGTATTVTVAKDATYTFAALARDGYRFLSWNTAANGTGTTYNVGDTITVTADLTLYAQWMANTDYIGQAVLSAADWAGGYVDTVNSVLDSVKDTAGNNGLAINDTLNLALTTGNMTSMEEGARTVTVTAQADLTENTVLNAARFAMDMVLPVVDGSTTPADLKQMIKDVAEQLGIELTKDQVDQMVGEIQEAAQSYLAQAMQDFKDNFRNYNGGDCITGMTLTFANGDEMTLTVGSITKNDAVQAAVKIARNLLNSANSADYTNQFDAQTSVKASFAPVDGIAASYTGEGAFPTDYTVKFVLDAQSDYLSYKLDADKGYYLKLTISQEMQNAYAGAVDELVNAALDNTTVQGKLDTVLNDALAGVSLDSYKGLLTQLGKTEEEAQQMLDGAVDAWVAANHLSAAEIKDSFLFQRYWEENASAAPDNSALYALIAAIGDDAGVFADETLRTQLAAMYESMEEDQKKALEAAGINDAAGYVNLILFGDGETGICNNVNAENFVTLIEASGADIGVTLDPDDPIQGYALAAICDYLRAQGSKPTDFKADAEGAMQDAINEQIDGVLTGNSMMTTLEKAVKVKTLAGIWDVKLSNASTALNNATLLELVGRYDDSNYAVQLRRAIAAVVNRIPAGAMVQIGNTTLTKDSLSGLASATTNGDLCQALADLITDNGLDDLSLSTFGDEATAPKITLGSASTNFAFTLVLDLEGA